MLIHAKIIVQPVERRFKKFRKLFQLERSSEASSIYDHSPKKNESRFRNVERQAFKNAEIEKYAN